jgi:hypothetical protein
MSPRAGKLPGMGEWDMHDAGAAPVVDENDRLAVGTSVTGIVVCHHHFGLGVRLDGRDEYGHVDITAIAPLPQWSGMSLTGSGSFHTDGRVGQGAGSRVAA